MGNIAAKTEYPPLLEDGMHVMCLTRLRLLTVWKFELSKRRPVLYDGLSRLVSELVESGVRGELWVNGSFLTEKIDPKDIDIVLRLPGDRLQSWSTKAKRKIRWYYQENLEKGYHCDHYVFTEYDQGHRLHEKGIDLFEYWSEQYGSSRSGEMKGIVVIKLEAYQHGNS